MKILITGATGYIGKRLIPILLNEGHHLICTVRDIARIEDLYAKQENIEFIEIDFLKADSLNSIPLDFDIAFYLIHSMSNSAKEFHILEERCAFNFKRALEKTTVKQVIYLSGITNDTKLSKHLLSRKNVEKKLHSNKYALTTFKAGVIVGSGSSSFEIIRDLVEKLPFMIAPKWLNTKTQPIGVRDVLSFLSNAIGKKELYHKSYDIFGPEILTYKEMLLQFAKVRGLKRTIVTVPIMTPKLSSYWLYFVTSTSYKLAKSLVESMKVEVTCRDNEINKILNIDENLLFTLLNIVDQDNKYLILTSTKPIVEHIYKLNDLNSRSKNFLLSIIENPGDDLMFALILKNLSDRQISIDKKLIDFIIKRIDRSYGKIFDFIYKIDEISLKRKKPIDFKIIKEALGE